MAFAIGFLPQNGLETVQRRTIKEDYARSVCSLDHSKNVEKDRICLQASHVSCPAGNVNQTRVVIDLLAALLLLPRGPC